MAANTANAGHGHPERCLTAQASTQEENALTLFSCCFLRPSGAIRFMGLGLNDVYDRAAMFAPQLGFRTHYNFARNPDRQTPSCSWPDPITPSQSSKWSLTRSVVSM